MGITSLVFASHSTLGQRTEPMALLASFCCNSKEIVLAMTLEVCSHGQDGLPPHEIGGSRTYTVGPNLLVLRFGLCGVSHCTPSWITSPCFHMKCRLSFWEGRTERESRMSLSLWTYPPGISYLLLIGNSHSNSFLHAAHSSHWFNCGVVMLCVCFSTHKALKTSCPGGHPTQSQHLAHQCSSTATCCRDGAQKTTLKKENLHW